MPVSCDPTEQQRVMLLSRSPSGPKKYFPIPVGHLEEEVRARSADDCKRFREEFNVSAQGPPPLVPRRDRGDTALYFGISSPKAQNPCTRRDTLPRAGARGPRICRAPLR